MNQRKLIKELGWKSTLKVRDYYGALYDPESHREIAEYVEVEEGDVISIVVCGKISTQSNKKEE